MLKKIDILGVGITSQSEDDILETVIKSVKNGKKFTIVTPNPEMLVYAKRHKTYQTILNGAYASLPDGVGVLLAARLLGKPLKKRVTGVDFIENLCKLTKEKPVSMGFLGGGPGIAEGAVECLQKKYPWINVTFVGSEWSEEGFRYGQVQSHKVIKSSNVAPNNLEDLPAGKAGFRLEDLKIKHPTIDILFVAFGVPKQEEWIAKHLDELPVTAAMGVGGSFDYISGNVIRAPQVIRAIGMEWLFRLILQPWRWRRQLALFEFVWLVIKETLFQRGANKTK